LRQSSKNWAPAHWSKDFVEHLRTVHFTLIGVCAGLILLLLSNKPYNPGTATRELDEIIELQSLWSPIYIAGGNFDSARNLATFDNFTDAGKARYPTSIPKRTPIDIASGPRRELLGTVHWAEKRHQKPSTFLFRLPELHWFLPEMLDDGYESFDFTSRDISLTSRTLGEFQRWWDSLLVEHIIAIPQELCPDGGIVGEQGGISGNHDGNTSYVSLDDKTAIYSEPLPRSDLNFGKPGDSNQLGFIGTLTNSTEFVFFPFSNAPSYKVSQGGLVSLFKNWRVGPFNAAFYDLDQATLEFKDLKLDRVSNLLSEQVGKGSEVFEAFGMKFPAGQVTLWGSFIVLSVQLYFLIYLRRLFGTLKAADPGWDVPWVGMDPSRTARIVLFMTLVLLPSMATTLLGWQAASNFSSSYWVRTEHFIQWTSPLSKWSPWVVLKIFGFVLVISCSVYLGVRSWRYRPKVEPEGPACGPQVFE
jgi:hypothetical protein